MTHKVDQLLRQFENGQIDRRQLLRGVALVAGTVVAGKISTAIAADAPLLPALSLNHLHIEVSDVKKSTEFYSVVYGAKLAASYEGAQTLILPSAKPGFGSWISLSTRRVDAKNEYDKTQGKVGHLSHVGFGTNVPIKEFPRIAKEVKARFPNVAMPNTPITEQAGQEMYVFDPDGIAFQMIPVAFNAWGTITNAMPGGPLMPGIASINHVHLEVVDPKKSVEFYTSIYGAKPLPGAGGLVEFPGAKKGFGMWANITTGRADTEMKYDHTDGKPGQIAHVGFGTTTPREQYTKVAEAIAKRFPNVKKPTTPITPQAGQEMYIFDPDGFPIQMIPVEFNGW